MRVAMARTQTAVEDAYSYEKSQETEWTPRESAAMKPLLVEQAWGESAQAAVRWNSEYRLMLAVLQDAVLCWFRYCHPRSAQERRMFQEIQAWFWDNDQHWLYAFESICEHLDLEASAIRRGLQQWIPLSSQQSKSSLQMRRVRRHKKIRSLDDIED
jgi:hypothetical protein